MSRLLAIILLGTALMAGGCSGYPGLFFTEHAHLGAQIKVSPTEYKPVDINIGYDRGILTVVPRTKKGEEAASVISKTDVELDVKARVILKNVFASGEAAKIITQQGPKAEDTPDAKMKTMFGK